VIQQLLKRFTFGLILAAAASNSGAHGQNVAAGILPEPLARKVSYTEDVHAILATKCYACHAVGKSRGDFKMDSRELFVQGGENGAVVVIGDSANSRLIKLVGGLDAELVMPPKGERLSSEEVAVLRAWIDQGLNWDVDTVRAATYLAPVKLREVVVPVVADGSQHPIDRILRAYFEKEGVQKQAPVSDEIFVRRAYIDVIGVPPSIDELNAFLGDQNANKRSELVKNLLGRNRAFAENWMTFWNDALRNDFKGTGYIDGGRKQITAWLYNALYSNVPYDQFATQLINPTEGSEGFINGIVWRGVVPAAERPVVQAARTTAQVFMGVNLKCASCHDSFIDHWKLEDAYALSACFSEGPMELVRCETPEGRNANARFLWPEVGSIDTTKPRSGRLSELARLVTSPDNGAFTRTIVNRLWAQFYGHGLVEPLHNIEKQPWNEDLLDWLSQDLIDNGYNLKKSIETMLTAEIYQWPAVARDPQSDERFVFRGPDVVRLSAEQLMDVMSAATNTWQETPLFGVPPEPIKKKDPKDPDPPDNIRAWRIESDSLSRALGRPNREQVMLRRENDPSTLQALELTNGAVFTAFSKRASEKLIASNPASAKDLASTLYLKALQRKATDDELAVADSMMGNPVTSEGIQDFLWALAMLPELQYRR
jgi:mono/diheme cytochrome c family protein